MIHSHFKSGGEVFRCYVECSISIVVESPLRTASNGILTVLNTERTECNYCTTARGGATTTISTTTNILLLLLLFYYCITAAAVELHPRFNNLTKSGKFKSHPGVAACDDFK